MTQQITVWTDNSASGRVIGLTDLKQMLHEKFHLGGDSDITGYPVSALAEVVGGITSTPTFFEVCGDDGFFARIPWRLANRSVLHFPTGSDDRGGGLRLLVDDSSSACVNVKSIVDVRFGFGEELKEPIFGNKLPNSKARNNQV